MIFNFFYKSINIFFYTFSIRIVKAFKIFFIKCFFIRKNGIWKLCYPS